jgi:HIRAN domain-containing protein
MSFLRRLLTRDEPEQPAVQPFDLGDRRGAVPGEALKLMASGGSLGVVGESHYRDAIEAVTDGPKVEGVRAITWATLVAEHDNPHDPHAVGVLIDGRKVGHLAREDAGAFWPIVERIQVAGRVAYCRADIYGGRNTSPLDRGDYRVTLYASGPEGQADLLARVFDGKSKAEIAAARPALRSGKESGPGTLRGRHHSAWHPEVDRLRNIGDQSAAVALLVDIVDATEAESRAEGFGIAPPAYETLAVIYRQRKDQAGEVAILERFARQKHAPGALPPRLLARLARIKAR